MLQDCFGFEVSELSKLKSRRHELRKMAFSGWNADNGNPIMHDEVTSSRVFS